MVALKIEKTKKKKLYDKKIEEKAIKKKNKAIIF